MKLILEKKPIEECVDFSEKLPPERVSLEPWTDTSRTLSPRRWIRKKKQENK